MSHILFVDSIIKSFNNTPLISDVHFCCETKDVVGIFGRNGSGKSTLLKIIYGTEICENKFVKIDNYVFNKFCQINNEISFLTQESFIPRNLLVNKAIKLFANIEDVDNFFNDEIISNIMNKKIYNLSGGELRYLEISLILNTNSKFTFLDEPFTGLSPLQIERVKRMIRGASINKGIVIIDHQYQDVLDISNKYYLLKNRSLISILDPRHLINLGYLPKL